MIARAAFRSASGLRRLLQRPRRFEIRPAGPGPTCVIARNSSFTVSKVLSALVYPQPMLDRIAEGLRKAGMAE
jgi:hypothetical protein